MAVLTILLPVVLVAFTNRLEWIATILAIIRTGACIAYFAVCVRLVPWRKHRGGTDRLAVREFVRLGGWMTLSNVLNPFLVSLDRVIIVGLVSISAVAYYSTPLEIITKLSIVPGAIVGVLFPAFATTFVGDKNRTLFLLSQGTKYTFFALFLPVIATVIFADEVLRVWLGLEFAANSGRVLQILAVGVLINSLAYPAVALLQGVGLPEKVAIFHLFEIVIYLPILWFLTHRYGIVGTAVAWTLRVALDTTILCSVALFQFPRKWLRLSHVMLPLLFFSALLITPFFMNEIIAKLCYFIASIILVFLVSWHFMLLHEEKKTISGYLRIAFEGITRK